MSTPAAVVGLPVAVGKVVQVESVASKPEKKAKDVAGTLHGLGYPPGLANEIATAAEGMPLRFWIVDNSGSMGACDGKRICGTRVVTSTRTLELQDAVTHQAELALHLGARTDFNHLNIPRGGSQFVTVASGGDTSGCPPGYVVDQLDSAVKILQASIQPCGSTPLTEAVNRVHSLLAPLAAGMRSRGELATVVIATDGLPDSPRTFLPALQLLMQRCPVWVVVRLCTDSERITDYWNALDQELERPLEVLDDVFGEADEVARYNDWLAYSPQLHAARLFGLRNHLFDFLDERSMPPAEIKRFAEVMLGCAPLPEPEIEGDASFIAALRAAVAQVPPVFDARRRQMRPFIDVDRVALKLKEHRFVQSLGPKLGPCLRPLAACVG